MMPKEVSRHRNMLKLAYSYQLGMGNGSLH